MCILTHPFVVACLLLPLAAMGQATRPAVPTTGTVTFDGREYRFTLESVSPTPPTVPPATPPLGTPAVSFVVTDGQTDAPRTVHVNGLGLTPAGDTPLTARYAWDFGDPGSPHDRLPGWTAAHTYDAPGTYTVRLTVTSSAGASATYASRVVVTPDARPAVHVSADGNDANPGTADRPVRSFARASLMVRDGVRVLFRRGDRFDVVDPMTVKHRGVLVGAYGDAGAPRPVLWRLTGEARTTITMFKPARDVTIQDLCFDSPFVSEATGFAPKIPADAVYAAGANVTVRRCEFRNVNDCVNSERKVDGLLVADNVAPLATGVRSYLVWGVGRDHAYVGNRMANSTREHCFRMVDVARVLVANNVLANPGREATDREDIAKGCVEMHRGSHAYVAGNDVTTGALRVGPRGGPGEDRATSTEWCVVEHNAVRDVSIQVRPGSRHVSIRDNVVRNPEGIKVYRGDAEGRVSTDLAIEHNTVVAPAELARLLMVEGEAKRVSLVGNLLVAPNMTMGYGASAAVYVGAADLACFTEVRGNVWPVPRSRKPFAGDGLFYIHPAWGDAKGFVSPEKWCGYPVVSNESFANVTIDDAGKVSGSPGGVTAGVRPR